MTPEQIATACGIPEYTTNVARIWPLVVDALKWMGIDDHLTQVAAAATITVETGSFLPIAEYGDPAYFTQELGAAQANYHGRGLIQLTWSYNYATYGREIGLDLVNDPDLALDPVASAKVLALYFRNTGIPARANAGNWVAVREAVNGGTNGWNVFYPAVENLLAIPENKPLTAVTVQVPAGPLYAGPKLSSRQVVALPAKQVIAFTGTVTPHWAEVNITLNGKKHTGWLLRGNLETSYQ